jgi:hypothetical protein
MQLLQLVNIQNINMPVFFDVVSLFTNVHVNEVIQFIGNRVHSEQTLAEQTVLWVDATAELLEL